MLNIHDLEIRQRRYKLKSYLPYIIALSMMIIILLTISVTYNKIDTIDSSPPKLVKVNEKIIKVEEKIIKVEEKNNVLEIPSVHIEKRKISFAPSMGFMNNIQSNNIPNYKEVKEVTIDVKVEKQLEETVKEVTSNTQVTVEKKQKLSIKKNVTNVQDIINRFKNSNSPALSLFIAKTYYKNEEYHKAYNYALITNEINNDIEDSWLIFSKSLVKLNEKKMAIKTLKKYIQHSHSSQAKILLNDILSGKFK